jgi:hypothetical protein
MQKSNKKKKEKNDIKNAIVSDGILIYNFNF